MNRAEVVNAIIARFDRQEAAWAAARGLLPRRLIYESVPLQEAAEILRSLGEPSLAAILAQRFDPRGGDG